MSVNIVTLAEMKAMLGIEDTDNDAILTDWMEGIEGRFDEHCKRVFARSASVTQVFDGGARSLRVKRYPIESISSVTIASDQDWATGTVLESDDYRYKGERGLVYYGTGEYAWPAGIQTIRIVYAGGYVAAGTTPGTGQTAMPEAVRRAMFLQGGWEWRNRTTLGSATVSAQGVTIQQGAQVALAILGRTLLPDVQATLEPFVNEV